MNNRTKEPRPALEVSDREFQLRRLAIGEQFEDCNGQQFCKLGVIVNRRGQRRHMVLCQWSPYGRIEPGPISSAFFTHIGAVLYLGGNQPVLRAKPVLALPWRAAA